MSPTEVIGSLKRHLDINDLGRKRSELEEERRSTSGRKNRTDHLDEEIADIEGQMTRRRWLALSVSAGVGIGGTVGVASRNPDLVFGLGRILFGLRDKPPLPAVAGKIIEVNPGVVSGAIDGEKATQIRRNLSQFEKTNENMITSEVIIQLAHYCSELYQATFGRVGSFDLKVLTSNEWKNQNLDGSDVPRAVHSFDMTQTPIKYTLLINLGRPEAFDPYVSRIAVFRSLIMLGLVNTQAIPVTGKTYVRGDSKIPADGKWGLNWTQNTNGKIINLNTFLQITNAIAIAEYLQDPTGQDSTFTNIARSSVYWQSLAPVYINGAHALEKIYQSLGISIPELEGYFHLSQPEGLLDLIKVRALQHGIELPPSYPSFLTEINPGTPTDEKVVKPLLDLILKLPQTF